MNKAMGQVLNRAKIDAEENIGRQNGQVWNGIGLQVFCNGLVIVWLQVNRLTVIDFGRWQLSGLVRPGSGPGIPVLFVRVLLP